MPLTQMEKRSTRVTTVGAVMKKSFMTLLVVTLLAGSLASPAEAKKRRTGRTVEGSYDAPALGAPGFAFCSPGVVGCEKFAAHTHERYVSVQIEDSLGTAVYARVSVDGDGDDTFESRHEICGATKEALRIPPGANVLVWIYEGPDPFQEPPCLGGASSGIITATFSNLPMSR